MLAVPTEPVETGSRFDTWPPHITLVPWFDLPTNRWQDFDARFKEEDIVWDLDSRVRVVKKELFGTNDAPIRVARLFGVISVLAHARSAELVREFGGEFEARLLKNKLGEEYKHYKALNNIRHLNGIQARMPYQFTIE